jgi:hypothetical protein
VAQCETDDSSPNETESESVEDDFTRSIPKVVFEPGGDTKGVFNGNNSQFFSSDCCFR